MEFCKGQLVIGLAGRERNRLLCVTDFDGRYVYLADGKERPLDNPKRKNPKHVQKTDKQLDESFMLTNRALRKALLREV